VKNVKHTKGKWINNPFMKFTGFRSIESDGKVICTLEAVKFESDEELEANAKLISAAPENLTDNIEWLNIHDELLKQNINIPKSLSDKIFNQVLKTKETIKKATN